MKKTRAVAIPLLRAWVAKKVFFVCHLNLNWFFCSRPFGRRRSSQIVIIVVVIWRISGLFNHGSCTISGPSFRFRRRHNFCDSFFGKDFTGSSNFIGLHRISFFTWIRIRDISEFWRFNFFITWSATSGSIRLGGISWFLSNWNKENGLNRKQFFVTNFIDYRVAQKTAVQLKKYITIYDLDGRNRQGGIFNQSRLTIRPFEIY